MSSLRADRLSLALAATTICVGLGAQGDGAMAAVLMLLPFGLVVAEVAAAGSADRRATDDRLLHIALVAQLALGAVLLAQFAAGGALITDGQRLLVTAGGAALATVGAVAVIRPRWVPGAAPIALALVAVPVLWFAANAPDSLNDVELFQEVGVDVLLAGGDPYASGIFVDLYRPAVSAQLYGDGLSVDGVLQFGFPYTPFGLLLAVPAVLLGDVRWLHIAAVLVSGLGCTLLAGTRRTAVAAPALLIVSAVTARMLAGTWTDTLVAALLVLLALAWRRGDDAVVDVLLGLLLATKQYTVLVVPFLVVLAVRGGRRPLPMLLRAGAAAAVVTLPFLVRNPQGFVFSTVVLQFLQPFRPTSISLLYVGTDEPATWTALGAFVVAVAIGVWALQRVRPDALGAMTVSTLVLWVFFLLSKQSFLNYYHVVIVGLTAMVAMADRGPGRDEDRSVGTSSRPSVTSPDAASRGGTGS